MFKKGQFACSHPRTPENSKPNGAGTFTCRVCRRARDRARPEVRRARQGRERNLYARMRRDMRLRIESKRERIAELEETLNA